MKHILSICLVVLCMSYAFSQETMTIKDPAGHSIEFEVLRWEANNFEALPIGIFPFTATTHGGGGVGFSLDYFKFIEGEYLGTPVVTRLGCRVGWQRMVFSGNHENRGHMISFELGYRVQQEPHTAPRGYDDDMHTIEWQNIDWSITTAKYTLFFGS